ncbi:hypothetical protein C1Y40_03483 [Mycobacterium talmoniae]|uniref:Uncharacterized protein n=1 Tax=Mycobacterium talmoniae TaxID=1858794 RepID=A0A2S8BI92_9MYCO|nr:hypothetical protein C1Y40_03483 [Mycobacterium talmoniae]
MLIAISRSVWWSKASPSIPVVPSPEDSRLVSCPRFSAMVRIGRIESCSASNSSGVVSRKPPAAAVNAASVDGPEASGLTTVLSCARISFRSCPASVSCWPRPSVASPKAAITPMLSGSGLRPAAASSWRSLATTFWNSTVGNVVSSWTTDPVRNGGALPLSTSCTADTAKALLGTTRAVTVLGILAAYAGVRSTWTMLGLSSREGVIPDTDPTSTPRNFTSVCAGNPSPMLNIARSTLTSLSSLPSDFCTINTEKASATTAKTTPKTTSGPLFGLRGSKS